MELPPPPPRAANEPSFAVAAKAACERRPLVFDHQSNKITLAELSSNSLPRVLDSPNDLAALASYCTLSRSIFGDATRNLRQLSMNTVGYEKDKARSFERFLQILSKHPALYVLTEYVVDPDNPEKRLFRLFPMLRGSKTEDKEQVLNDALVVFVSNLKTKEGKAYQPNVVKKILDQIFAIFRSHGIQYSMTHMQSMQGSFQAYCANQFREEAERRPDYGRRPNKGLIEFNDDVMLRTKEQPPMSPFQIALDCLRMVVYLCSRCWGTRGMEVSFNHSC